MSNNEMILVPRELTDEMGEAIASAAGVCGGIAYEIWEAVIAAAKPAAQHQGEPVTQIRSHGSDCWEDISGESLELCKAQPEEYEVRTLYAEQPALAAVVLPDCMLGDDGVCTESHYSSGWNACLDEVTRLNTK